MDLSIAVDNMEDREKGDTTEKEWLGGNKAGKKGLYHDSIQL